MELVRESVRALAALAALAGAQGAAVTATIRVAAEEVVRAVPHCVGMSITLVRDGRSVTVLATSSGVATLDATQYLDGGPCQDAMTAGAELTADLTREERWTLFAQAAAAQGVRSSRSFPLRAMGRVIGAVTLYAATTNAFDHGHHELASIFASAVEDVVENVEKADLPRSSRAVAAGAEADRWQRAVVDQATDILVAACNIPAASAQTRLANAAERAGISVTEAASGVLHLRSLPRAHQATVRLLESDLVASRAGTHRRLLPAVGP